jgi:hypothetical protein
MPERLSSWGRAILERPHTHATLATVSADGSPHQAVLWFTVVGDDDVLVNSKRGRIWPTNLLRSGRFSLLIGGDHAWISLRGRVETLDDPVQAREDIAAMARVYHDDEPETIERSIAVFREQDRISFLLRVEAVTEHPD